MNKLAQPSIDVSTTQPVTKVSRRRRPFSLLTVIGQGLRLLILLLFVIFFGAPLLWLLLAPSKTEPQLFTLPPLAFGSLQNYITSWQHLLLYNDAELLTWTWNSILYSVSSVVLSVAICLMAGYALAISNFRGRKLILLLTLIVSVIPGFAFVLPIFLELNAVQLINTSYSVIFPSVFYPFGVYLAFIYFATSLPPNLLSAGRVDGCNNWQLFRYIALPLAKPVVGLLAFFSFVGNWNNFFLPSVMLTDDTKYNLPVGLATLLANAPWTHPGSGTAQLPIMRPDIAMAGLFVVFPVAIIFIFTQRFVIAGMFAGAEKG